MKLSDSVLCPVRTAATEGPDSVAISSPDGDVSYGELDGIVGSAASEIRDAKLCGERVGLYLGKSASHVALLFALLRAGSVAVEVSTRIPPAEVTPMLRRAGCTSVVTEDEEIKASATLHGIRVFGTEEFITSTGDTNRDEEPRIPLAGSATVVFTSGSTGVPKAALHTFGNHYANAVGSAENIALSPGDVWLHSLPLYHVGGLSILFRCAVAGATMALPGTGERIGASIRRSGATHVSLVATQLGRLLDEDADLSNVKVILLGGSGIPETLLDRAHDSGLPVHTSYGLTEMASQVTTSAPNASRRELTTSGRLLTYRELRISEEGEILVRGDTLFSGYVDGDDLTLPLDKDGWFHTKDLGHLDSDGLLTVTGRLDNLFISGGENVQPEEIEEALRRTDGISDAVVVPVPDEEFGARPVAFVKSDEASPDDLTRRLRETLPGFKIPVAFHEWPEDAPGGMKVDRTFFRERAASLSR